MLYTKEFWLDAIERVVGTMAEVAIPLLTVTVNNGVIMDIQHIVTVVLGSGIICFLKCLVKATGKENESNRDSES